MVSCLRWLFTDDRMCVVLQLEPEVHAGPSAAAAGVREAEAGGDRQEHQAAGTYVSNIG